MSIQSEIKRISGNVSDAYEAVGEKGGTLPEIQNSDNLAAAIREIPTDFIPYSEKGTASGVASLGSDGKVPTGQMPYQYSDTDLTAGTSPLATGTLYLVYE